jgi:hypothetical protein
MRAFEELLAKLGPAPKQPDIALHGRTSKLVRPGESAVCQRCKKVIFISDGSFFSTDRVTGVCDVTCRDCFRDLRGTARLVCLVCRQVVLRLVPKKMPTGFIIEAGKFYHTDKCPICAPDLTQSVILEMKAWESMRGNKY